MQAVLKELTGRDIDTSVRVVPPFYPDGGHNLRFGRNVFVNHGCTAVVVGGVEIGDDVMIGPNVQLISGGHSLDPATRRSVSTCAPVRIGRGAWVGAGATILPGVTVGEDAVVAAGAVVTRDVAPRTLVGGVPAGVIRELQLQRTGQNDGSRRGAFVSCAESPRCDVTLAMIVAAGRQN